MDYFSFMLLLKQHTLLQGHCIHIAANENPTETIAADSSSNSRSERYFSASSKRVRAPISSAIDLFVVSYGRAKKCYREIMAVIYGV
jgi:hypothetical protein